MKQPLRIFFTDFWIPFDVHDNVWLDILGREYDVRITPENPDFLFHSCFGRRHLGFDCVKICILGENLTPDFNLSDYACGFDHLHFEDRYMRVPLYRFHIPDDAYRSHDRDFYAREAASKTKFCSFLYSNARSASPHRERFLDALSAYRPVDSGGMVRNTIGYAVDDKLAWQRRFKFTIAFENSCKNGYTTEKICDALAAHTIPIYWGNPRVAEEFNPGRIINCHEYASLDEVVARVKELDADPARYTEMLSRPWFAGDTPPPLRDDPEHVDFLLAIVRQGPRKARRTTRHGASSVYFEDQKLLARAAPVGAVLLKARNAVLKLRRMMRGGA